MVDLLTVYGSSGHGRVRCLMRLILLRRGRCSAGASRSFRRCFCTTYLPPRGSGSSVSAGLATWHCNLPTIGAAKSTHSPRPTRRRRKPSKLGAHYVHNTRRDGELKKIAASLDLIISTINVPLDIPGLLETLAPKGILHVVGAVLEPMPIPAFP